MNEYPSISQNALDKERVNWLKYCDWGKFVPILYVSTTGGLCNRVLGLASCMAKLKAENRRLVVYWPRNGEDGTSALWEDVFLDKIDTYSEWDLYWMMDVMHEVRWYDDIQEAYSRLDTVNIVVMKSSYDFFACAKTNPAFDHSQAINWLKSLRIQPCILERVDSFDLHMNTLGVHLRVGDPKFSDTYFSEDPITTALCEKVKNWPGRVLVISNSLDTKQRMVAMFGPKIITQTAIRYDRSSEGIQDAMVDLLLLSRCQERIGNNMSTFFKLANYWA